MKALRFFGNLMLVDFFFLTCNMKILKNTEGKLGITLQWTFMHQSPGFHHWHFTNMVGPWTMWELGGQPHTVENLHITFDSLKIACWPEALHKQSDNTYFVCYMSVYCIPIINLKKMLLRKIHLQFLLKKKMHISGPAHYKPMLFRGHLYFLHHVSVSPSTSGRFITVLLNLKHHSLLDSAHFYNLYTHSHVNTIIP